MENLKQEHEMLAEKIAQESYDNHVPKPEEKEEPETEVLAEKVASKAKSSEKAETLKAEISEKLGSKEEAGPIVMASITGGPDTEPNRIVMPPVKLVGETLNIDGEMYEVIAKDELKQSTNYKVKNLRTGEIKPKDHIELDGEAKKRQDALHDALSNRFEFTTKDLAALENDPNYSKLTIGQKHFIINSLTSSTLEKVDEVAPGLFQEDLAKKGWAGRARAGIFKNSKMAALKAKAFDELREGGYEKHKDSIDALVSRVQMMDVPIIENAKNEVEVQYGSKFADLIGDNPETLRAQSLFNQAATALHNIPQEWEGPAATFTQRRAAEKIKRDFEQEKQYCIDLYYKNKGEAATAAEIENRFSDVDNSINLNRLMNAHPDNEKVLNNLQKDSLRKGLGSLFTGNQAINATANAGKDIITRDNKLYYAIGGGALRAAGRLTDAAGYSIAMGAGLVVGGLRGFFTGDKNLRENEAAMRRGGVNKLSKEHKKGMFDIAMDAPEMTSIMTKEEGGVGSVVEKINLLAKQLGEEQDSEKAKVYRTRLQNRVDHVMARAKQGKISFGNKEVRLKNQVAFMEAIKKATTVSAGTEPAIVEEYKDAVRERMEVLYGKANAEEQSARNAYLAKFATKNAVLGMAFGGVGYAVTQAWDAVFGGNPVAGTQASLENSGVMPSEAHQDAFISQSGIDSTTVSRGNFMGDIHSMDPASPLDRNFAGSSTDYISDRTEDMAKPPFAEGYTGDYVDGKMPPKFGAPFPRDMADQTVKPGDYIPRDPSAVQDMNHPLAGSPVKATGDYEDYDAERFKRGEVPRSTVHRYEHGDISEGVARGFGHEPDPTQDAGDYDAPRYNRQTDVPRSTISPKTPAENYGGGRTTNVPGMGKHGIDDSGLTDDIGGRAEATEAARDAAKEAGANSGDYVIKPEKIEFSAKGSIETIRQLKEKLAADYADVSPEKIPSSVKEILDNDPTKLAIKFGFYKPGEVDESAMVLKGSTLEVDSAGNLNYHAVGKDTYHIIEHADGTGSYKYDEKMFDYNGKTVRVAGANEANQINYPHLDKPDESIFADKGAQYEAAMAAKNAASAKEAILPQYGKSLTGETYQSTSTGGYYQTSNPDYAMDRSGRTGGMSGSFGETQQDIAERVAAEQAAQQEAYNATNQAAQEAQGGYGSQPAGEQMFQIDRNARFDLPKSPDGTYYKEVKINGQFVQLDTHSFNQNNAFDGVVNRRYEKLFDDTFGDDNKQIEVLLKSRAVDDLNAKPINPNDQITTHYLNMVKKIRADSGLAPKPNEPTSLYLKEALQRMKNNGTNIRQYTNDLSATHMQNGGIVVNGGNQADNSSVVSNGNINKVKIISNKPKNIITDDVYK
ncbi:MAG: hypothetical protein KBC67_02215 [Candidatus Pacebacteria bacterium]|nr:hypothetical protein [Candidatus Paceibacterota bacterium]